MLDCVNKIAASRQQDAAQQGSGAERARATERSRCAPPPSQDVVTGGGVLAEGAVVRPFQTPMETVRVGWQRRAAPAECVCC